MVDQPAELARQLGRFHWVYGANLDMDADLVGGQGAVVQRRRRFGNMILSRWPILSSRNFPLPKFGTLRQHSIQQGALEAIIRTPRGPALRIYPVHLGHLAAALRLAQVDRCSRSTSALRPRAEPVSAAIPIRPPAGSRVRCRRCRQRRC